MSTSIYSPFSQNIRWIRRQIVDEAEGLPDSLRGVADYYLKSRLIIDRVPGQRLDFDPELGRPVPYAVYWFSDALGLDDPDVVRRLSLALVYSSLATTVRDDMVDGGSQPCDACFKLFTLYNHDYLSAFDDLFESSSVFWSKLLDCVNDQLLYEKWKILPLGASVDPLSDSFLWDSSRYFSAVVLPALAATAILTGNESRVPEIARFLKIFSMGWRIFDDLMDWEKDLADADYNRSSVLMYLARSFPTPLNGDSVRSMFLDPAVINRLYGVMLSHFSAAREAITPFRSSFLTKFMDEQVRFHERRRDAALGAGPELYRRIGDLLEK